MPKMKEFEIVISLCAKCKDVITNCDKCGEKLDKKVIVCKGNHKHLCLACAGK